MAGVREVKNKDGEIISYQASIYLGRDSNGKQIKCYHTYPVPTETPKKQRKAKILSLAVALEETLKKDYNPDKPSICDRNITFKDFVEQVFMVMHVDENKNMASTSRDYYRYNLARAVDFFSTMKIGKINTLNINQYLLHLQRETKADGNNLSDKTIRHHKTALNAVFSYAKKNKIIDSNPVDDAEEVSVRRKPIKALSSDDARNLLHIVDENTDIKHQCMIKFLLYYGIRRGELCGLQWKDIHLTDKSFEVVRNVSYSKNGGVKVGDTKTQNSDRPLTLCDDLIESLSRLRAEQKTYFAPVEITPECYVFSSEYQPDAPMSPQSITRWVNRFSEKYNLSNVTPHLLRHTVATLMKANGASDETVQNTLGHSDFRVTKEYYIGKNVEVIRAESDSYINTLLKK